jgi:putative ABC transport system permease protein
MTAGLRRFFARLASVFRTDRAEKELAREIASHLSMLEDEYIRRGLSFDDARRAARLALGGVDQTTELHRRARSLSWLDDAWRDVGHAARVHLRNPGFTLVASTTLALGIGANVAIFGVVRAVLLTELPYTRPDRLVLVGEAGSDGTPENVSFTTFADWRTRVSSLADISVIRPWNPTIVGDGQPERLQALKVSWNFFQLLGIRPALGRDFVEADDSPERWRVLLLSDSLWKRRFGGDPHVLGRTVLMNDREYTIVGVLPATFEPLISGHFYQPAELWAPLGYATTDSLACRSCQHLKALGRLAHGVSVDQARAEIDTIHEALRREHPKDYTSSSMAVVPLEYELTRRSKPALLALSVAVTLILLLACANIANLLVVRATARHREISLRAALGASRGRLVRQLLTESLVVALLGGAGGLVLAFVGLRGLIRIAPGSIARLENASLDSAVLLFTTGIALATALLVGAIPAFRVSRVNLQHPLEGESRSVIGPRFRAFRAALVVIEVALTLVLLVGGGLMLKTVARLGQINPGFDPANVLTLQISLSGRAYAENAQVVAVTEQIIDRIRSLPGVEAVAVVSEIPLGGGMDRWQFHVEGRALSNAAEVPSVERYSVTPEYFRLMRIPIRRGRAFTANDRHDSLPTMLVSETTARQLWPGQDPIGQRVRVPDPDRGPWRTIVGIVGDVRHYDVASAPTMQMYLPQSQETASFLTLAIRATQDPGALTGPVRREIWNIAREVPVYDVATMADLVARSTARQQFVMRLLGLFAATALMLASVGLYGVLASLVAQRTHEVGLRIALGARRWDIAKLVGKNGLFLVLVGLGIGLGSSVALARLLQGLLYETAGTDPAVLGAVAAILCSVGLVAHVVPMWRAIHIDPAVALRQQ